jgi:histidinol dehydrogenase
VVLVRSLEEGVRAVNALAPEHAEVMARGALGLARRVVAGGVFAGAFTPVAVGDYGIGPNHVLPTGGAARFSSPLSVRDFERRQSLVHLTRRDLVRVAADVVAVARAEGFPAHAQSVATRFAAQAVGTGRKSAPRKRRPTTLPVRRKEAPRRPKTVRGIGATRGL